MASSPAVVLTIAGSDPSGGAGIQADLKTFSALDVYGMSVITAITIQNTVGISKVFEIPAPWIADQIDRVVRDIRPTVVKVGMLQNSANVRIVKERLLANGLQKIVLDPVLASKSGTPLLEPRAIDVLREELMPIAFLITPNLDEAEVLLGIPVRNRSQMREAAVRFHAMGVPNVVITGGHLAGDNAVDVFFDGREIVLLDRERISARDSHGTGCVLSAAIAAQLARGFDVGRAVEAAKSFTAQAIQGGLRLGQGIGPCDPLGLSQGEDDVGGATGKRLEA